MCVFKLSGFIASSYFLIFFTLLSRIETGNAANVVSMWPGGEGEDDLENQI